MQGKIIKGIAGFYYVYAEDGQEYECKAKGIFRKDKIKPLVGDQVELDVLNVSELTGNITKILPRKNSLIRPAVAGNGAVCSERSGTKPESAGSISDHDDQTGGSGKDLFYQNRSDREKPQTVAEDL